MSVSILCYTQFILKKIVHNEMMNQKLSCYICNCDKNNGKEDIVMTKTMFAY